MLRRTNFKKPNNFKELLYFIPTGEYCNYCCYKPLVRHRRNQPFRRQYAEFLH